MHKKRKLYLKAFIAVITIVFATSAFASNLDSGRIIPGEKVLIYQGDQQVGELTAEAPFPDGALLACDGECAVRMGDLYLVGGDESLFSVTTRASSRELQVMNGTVYFALSKLPHSIVFVTPGGAVTAQQLILNAAADRNLLTGYVAVTEESSEIGVMEGGSMLVTTTEGETTIPAGNKIVLAQTNAAQPPGAQPSPSTGGGGGSLIPLAISGAVAGGAPVAFALATDSDSGGKTGSPAEP